MAKNKRKKKDGLHSAYTGLQTNQDIPLGSATTQDLSLSKPSISSITVADFVALLPAPPQDLMYEFLDAIELEQNAPQRERAAMIEALNSRLSRLRMVANAYNASVAMGKPHEGLMNELEQDGIENPENIDSELRSDEVYLKQLQQQYEDENKGTGIDAEWFESVLKSVSDYKKYYVSDDIKLSRFCMYYKEMSKAVIHG